MSNLLHTTLVWVEWPRTWRRVGGRRAVGVVVVACCLAVGARLRRRLLDIISCHFATVQTSSDVIASLTAMDSVIVTFRGTVIRGLVRRGAFVQQAASRVRLSEDGGDDAMRFVVL